MDRKFGVNDEVRVINQRWWNIPVGYIGMVEKVRDNNYILPITVWFDNGTEEGIYGSFDPEDLELSRNE